jgi:hydrogenase/urease accessory protein HupE
MWCYLCLVVGTGWAHDLGMAGIRVRLDKDSVTVSVRAHLHQLGSGDLAAAIARRLHLRLDGEPFAPVHATVMRDDANGIAIWQARRNGPAATVAVDAPLFPDQANGGTIVTVFEDGRVLNEALVDVHQPTAVLGQTAAVDGAAAVILRFLREGVLHIFGGPDHILFILGLLLLGGSLRQLVKIVSAFTLAHSITLTLAATGILALSPRLVEPLIALSIVAVALENLRHRASPHDIRPWLAFGFGLIHGFGFAGALAEVGLPRESLALALVAFNLGVEMGQATIVLFAAPLIRAVATNWPKIGERLVWQGSLGVAAMGCFWLVQRLLGG